MPYEDLYGRTNEMQNVFLGHSKSTHKVFKNKNETKLNVHRICLETLHKSRGNLRRGWVGRWSAIVQAPYKKDFFFLRGNCPLGEEISDFKKVFTWFVDGPLLLGDLVSKEIKLSLL